MNFELQLARSWQEQLSFKKQTWPEVPLIPPVSPSSANKLSLSVSAYIHSWVPPPSLAAPSTTLTLLSCFPILFKPQLIWAEVQTGAQKLLILNRAFGINMLGLELGKALLQRLASTAAPQHGQGQAGRKVPASPISPHYFVLTETNLSLTLLSS